MNYAEKLKDPRWQMRRLEIMKRDKAKCLICGNGRTTLNVHHVRYFFGRDPWDYPDELLMTLCENCHESWKKEDPYVLAAYRYWNLTTILEDRVKEVERMQKEFAHRELAAIMKTMGIDELEFNWDICMEIDNDDIEFLPIPYAEKTVYRLLNQQKKSA